MEWEKNTCFCVLTRHYIKFCFYDHMIGYNIDYKNQLLKSYSNVLFLKLFHDRSIRTKLLNKIIRNLKIINHGNIRILDIEAWSFDDQRFKVDRDLWQQEQPALKHQIENYTRDKIFIRNTLSIPTPTIVSNYTYQYCSKNISNNELDVAKLLENLLYGYHLIISSIETERYRIIPIHILKILLRHYTNWFLPLDLAETSVQLNMVEQHSLWRRCNLMIMDLQELCVRSILLTRKDYKLLPDLLIELVRTNRANIFIQICHYWQEQ